MRRLASACEEFEPATDASADPRPRGAEGRADEWFILDASSRNGTFVRAERIEKETKLQGPTVLQFGNVQAMFIPRRV